MRRVFDRLDTPTALGYSCAGTVHEVGGKVGAFSVGIGWLARDRTMLPMPRVFVPKHLCVRIPEGVDFEEASFVTLGAIALQGDDRRSRASGSGSP